MFGKNLHQQEYKVLRKGLDTGLSKQQISNLFGSQGALRVANISPLTAIGKFSGARNGEIRADFYDDCQDIPDPLALDPTQKNLLLLDDCFLGKQNKAEAYYSRRRHNNWDTIFVALNYFRLPRHTVRENSNFIILFPQVVNNLTHIHADHCASGISLSELKQLCHEVKHEATGGTGGGGGGGIPPPLRRYFAPNSPPPQKKRESKPSFDLSEWTLSCT